MNQSTFTVYMLDATDTSKQVVVTLPGNCHAFDNNNAADLPAFDAFCTAAIAAAEQANPGFDATACVLNARADTNTQNRTADGRIATVKEACRADCVEMIARYYRDAKTLLRDGDSAAARILVRKCAELRAAFFSDFAEKVAA